MNCRLVVAVAVLSLLAGCRSRKAVERTAAVGSEAVETVRTVAVENEILDDVVREERTEWEFSPPDSSGRQYVNRVSAVSRQRVRKTERDGSRKSERCAEVLEHREQSSVQTTEAETRLVFRHVAWLAIAAALLVLTLKISRK